MDRSEIEKIVRDVLSEKMAPRHAANSRPPASPQIPIGPGDIPDRGHAAVLTDREKIELREFPLREIRPDEILIRVEACGICGTDVHCYKNDPFNLIPVVLGHEGTGEVAKVGSAITMDSVGKPVRVGDKIVTSTLETSDACMIAKYNPAKANLCDDLRIYGLLPDEPENHFNGYFGEWLIIRPGSSFFVVNDMSLDLRVLIEPAAVAAHALERARVTGLINFRSRVVVQGCGPIGLMLVAILRTAGVNNIIAIDGNDERLALARELGADHTVNFRNFPSPESLAEEVLNVTKGIGAHFAFSVTGVPQAASTIFKLVRRGGGVCEVGFFVENGLCSINPHEDFCKKEITLVGTWAYNSWEYPNAYHFLQRAERIGLPIQKLITHRYSLDQIHDGFQTNLRQEGIKVIIENPGATT